MTFDIIGEDGYGLLRDQHSAREKHFACLNILVSSEIGNAQRVTIISTLRFLSL